MELKTVAYLPISFGETGKSLIIASNEMILKGTEIIGFVSMGENYHEWDFIRIGRQPYSRIELHPHEQKNIYHGKEILIKISFMKDNRPVSVYIKKTRKNNFRIKWMNNEYWLQKGNNLTWTIGIIIAISVAIVGWRLSWVISHIPKLPNK